MTRTLEGLTPGIPYRLKFFIARRLDGLGDDNGTLMEVRINGNLIGGIFPIDPQWRMIQLPTIVPTSTAQSLSITGNGTFGATCFDSFEINTDPQTEILTGGNFDVPNVPNGAWAYSPSFLAGGWSFGPLAAPSRGAGLAANSSTWGTTAQSGNMFCFIQRDGYAEQRLENLTVGAQYAVRFHQSSRGNNQNHSVQLELDGNQFYGPVSNRVGWLLRTTPLFTATAPTMMLRFEGPATGGDQTSLIDTVEVLPSTAGHDLRFNLLQSEVQPDSTFLTPISVNVLQNGTSVFTTSIVAPPFGIFRPNIPLAITGPVTIVFDSPTHLKKRVAITLPRANPNAGFVTLVNGDADASGEVDALDIDLVISKFGTTVGAANYITNADVDQSAEVDASDVDIVISNFGALDQ